jgi:ATP-dependent protease ClpP protease subunit
MLHTSYEPDRAVIPITGTITRDTAYRVCSELDVAVSYYRYRRVALVVDSPGGETGALDMIVRQIADYRAGVRLQVETHVAGEAASAAAMIVALGCVPFRTCARGTRLLMHEPRAALHGNGRMLTHHDLMSMGESLQSQYHATLDLLTTHVWQHISMYDQLPITSPHAPDEQRVLCSPDALRHLYAEVFGGERWLTPAEAIGLRLIDRISRPGGSHGLVGRRTS